MAGNRYSDPRGSGWEDRERGRFSSDYDRDRGRSEGRGGGDEDRGFFERAGEEIRSWFGSEDDDRGGDYGRSRDRFERSEGQYGRGGGQSGFGSGRQFSRPQGWGEPHPGDRWREGGSSGGSDFSRNRGEWNESRMGGAQGGFGRDRESFRSGQGGRDSSVGYNDLSGNLGGFGNQTFGSSQDDHYRSWRDRQMEQLDRDYQDYCRERETQFHQDFDSWRQGRQGQQTQSGEGQSVRASQSSGQSQSGSGKSSGTAAAQPSGSSGSSSFLGGGSDPSAATAGGGGDPTPQPAAGSPSGSRSNRSRPRS